MPKKRKITSKLEEIFGVPFHKLIGDNFKEGDSRYKVQKRLLEMIVEKGLVDKALKAFPETKDQWNPRDWTYDNFGAVSKETNSAFRPSALYHAIKDAIDSDDLKFDFNPSNKGRKSDTHRKRPTVVVELTCNTCSTKHKNTSLTDPKNLNLRVYACPKCGTFGKCVARVNEGGRIRYKAVVKKDGIRQEVFVNSPEDLTPVEELTTPGSTEEIPITSETGQQESKIEETNSKEVTQT